MNFTHNISAFLNNDWTLFFFFVIAIIALLAVSVLQTTKRRIKGQKQTIISPHEDKKLQHIREENREIFITFLEVLEDRFKNNIINKNALNEKLVEFRYQFKSEHIEFDFSFKDQIYASFESSQRHGFYRFNSPFDIKGREDFSMLLDKIAYLLDGNVIFGDIYFHGNLSSCFWSDMSVYRSQGPADIDQILNDAAEDIYDEGEYSIHLYGSREFGSCEVKYIKSVSNQD